MSGIDCEARSCSTCGQDLEGDLALPLLGSLGSSNGAAGYRRLKGAKRVPAGPLNATSGALQADWGATSSMAEEDEGEGGASATSSLDETGHDAAGPQDRQAGGAVWRRRRRRNDTIVM
jgi:hypothetical protein